MLGGRKNYNFSDRTHSKDGKLATLLGAAAWVIMLFLICKSITSGGNVGAWFGLLGLIDIIIAFCGMVIAIIGFKDEDTFKLFPRIGLFANGILLLGLLALFVVGMGIFI